MDGVFQFITCVLRRLGKLFYWRINNETFFYIQKAKVILFRAIHESFSWYRLKNLL